MNPIIDISLLSLAGGYLLLIFPGAIMLYLRVGMMKETAVAVLRMTVQLLFVGLYLQVVFKLDNPFLNLAWVAAMILVADLSILKGCRLKLKRFLLPMFTALVVGTVLPMIFFAGIILRLPGWFEAQYVIPLAGMILGNCLRADIIGLNRFYQSIHKNEKAYHQSLAYGAALTEAVAPFFREALRSALAPTIASMATIGLVSLPGMMTGVILAGADPFTAIKYQIGIMIAIFSGTAITVFLAIRLTVANSFNAFGILHPDILQDP